MLCVSGDEDKLTPKANGILTGVQTLTKTAKNPHETEQKRLNKYSFTPKIMHKIMIIQKKAENVHFTPKSILQNIYFAEVDWVLRKLHEYLRCANKILTKSNFIRLVYRV